MEDGTLDAWYWPQRGPQDDFGGGEYNSGSGVASASTARARSGSWSAELALADGSGGSRLFRWQESRTHRELVYRAWFFLPVSYVLTGDPLTGRYWDIFQFKSVSGDGTANDPIWFINVRPEAGGRLVPELVWWHPTLEGPHEGEFGNQGYAAPGATVPVGRWFRISALLRQSKDFDGAIRIWLDDKLIFDLRDVRTGHENCAYNSWCVDQGWSVNSYSDGLAPTPSTLYVDDVQIETAAPRRAGAALVIER